MIAHAAFLAAMLTLALVGWILSVTTALAPYKRILMERHLWTIVGAIVVVFVNLFAACYGLGRILFLRDTGRKLAHVDRQIHGAPDDPLAEDLRARLEAP